jgi:hypothetical protein
MSVHMLTRWERYLLARKQWKARQEQRLRARAEGRDTASFIGWEKWEQHVMAVETLESIDAFLSQGEPKDPPLDR